MNYWIFKANPEHYRIDDRLLDNAPDITWSVTRYLERIQKGDTVFIWRTGTPRGICAIMNIEECPYAPEDKDLNDGYQLQPVDMKTASTAQWTKGRLIKRFQTIETSVIKKIPGLELFSFFSAFPQATNFTITRPEGMILLEFIDQNQVARSDKKPEMVSKPAAKSNKPVQTRATSQKKARTTTATDSDFALLKCELCGRYVVKSDTARHIQEMHQGQMVEWKKMK
jgi:predicted RNA-binding protein with PUA-like domain